MECREVRDLPKTSSSPERDRKRVGLCADCRYAQKIKSDRGAVFYRCERSRTDPTFPKYPRLPVVQCSGYEKTSSADNSG
jgi:hypothetical protein